MPNLTKFFVICYLLFVIACTQQVLHSVKQGLLFECINEFPLCNFYSSNYCTVNALSSEYRFQPIPWNIKFINADKAAEYVGKEAYSKVQVAVIDTGVDYDHEDFRKYTIFINGYPYYYWGDSIIKWGYNEITDEENLNAVEDRNGHGTHCAGIIGALDNDIGTLGVAPGIKIYVIKAINDNGIGNINDIIDAIYRAAKGPDGIIGTDDDPEVISMSFGTINDVPALHNAVKWAYTHGIILVAAAGNYDPLTNPNTETTYPARYPEVIAVGAVDENGEVPEWSAEGEIYAPGVNIYSTYRDNTYRTLNGTSMACPHVAATAALMIAQDLKDGFRDLTPALVKEILLETARDVNGIKIVDAYAAVKAVPTHNGNSQNPSITPLNFGYNSFAEQIDNLYVVSYSLEIKNNELSIMYSYHVNCFSIFFYTLILCYRKPMKKIRKVHYF